MSQRLFKAGSVFGNKVTKMLERKAPLADALKRWDITKGDKVHILEGQDAGKQGEVLKVIRKFNALQVKGLKMKKRFEKANEKRAGYQYLAEGLIHVSNVNLIDPVSGKPTRLRHQFTEDGSKVRVAARSGSIIPKPDRSNYRAARTTNKLTDTLPENVLKVTYIPTLYPIAPKEKIEEAEAEAVV